MSSRYSFVKYGQGAALGCGKNSSADGKPGDWGNLPVTCWCGYSSLASAKEPFCRSSSMYLRKSVIL